MATRRPRARVFRINPEWGFESWVNKWHLGYVGGDLHWKRTFRGWRYGLYGQHPILGPMIDA